MRQALTVIFVGAIVAIAFVQLGIDGPQTLFERWWWGYVIVPFTLSVLAGVIGANLANFKECQRRGFYEIIGIAQSELATKKRTLIEYRAELVNLNGRLYQLGHDCRDRGYRSLQLTYEKIAGELTNAANSIVLQALRHPRDALEAAAFNEAGVSDYAVLFTRKLPGFADRVYRQRADWLEIIEAPTFARWKNRVVEGYIAAFAATTRPHDGII